MIKKNRIGLTLSDELDGVITTLSKLTNSPKTAVITELLMESLPVMRMVISSLESVKQDKQQAAIDTMGKFLQDASGLVNQAHIDFGEVKGILKAKINDK
jgi:hypothetical protein